LYVPPNNAINASVKISAVGVILKPTFPSFCVKLLIGTDNDKLTVTINNCISQLLIYLASTYNLF